MGIKYSSIHFFVCRPWHLLPAGSYPKSRIQFSLILPKCSKQYFLLLFYFIDSCYFQLFSNILHAFVCRHLTSCKYSEQKNFSRTFFYSSFLMTSIRIHKQSYKRVVLYSRLLLQRNKYIIVQLHCKIFLNK